MVYLRSILLILLIYPWALVQAANLDIEINGVGDNLKKNVQAYLSIYKESQSTIGLHSVRIQQLHKQAESEIKNSLQPFGYYAVSVTKKLVQDENSWVAQYEIELGEQIRIQQVDFNIIGEGKNSPSILDMLKGIPLRVGSVLDHSMYEDEKQRLLKVALTEGYLHAKYTVHEIKVDLEKYHASIKLEFNTGPRYLFGTVRFVQFGEQLDEQFLERYLPFKTGMPYSTAKLLELQSSLSDSDQFSRIEINQLFNESSKLTIPLDINVTPRKPRRYRFGLGYGTDSGARASVEHQRRVSPKGHILTLKTKISERINRVDMQYTMPLKKPASEQLAMNTHYVEQVTESRKSYAAALDLRHITGRKKWRQAIAITYEWEEYRVANESGSSNLLMPNFELLRNSFNNRLYPTKGNRLTAEVWVSNDLWFSDADFLQLKLTGKWIFPFLKNGRFISKLHAGGTLVEDIDHLPASKRFYTGGDQSIRGYGYEELGPTDANGNTIGGKYLGVAGIEYEHRILNNWGLAIFFDAGNSFINFKEPIYRGAGVGGRWRSAVGPIRLDFAWPLDKDVEYPHLHLVIGLDL